MAFFDQQQQPYGQPSGSGYYNQGNSAPDLQFYSTGASPGVDQGFYGSRPSLEGNMASGNATVGPGPGFGGNMQNGPTGWLAAFSSTGFEGELPLLEGWTLLILL